MSLCLLAGATLLTLGAQGRFTLEWQHSVEHEGWREEWQVEGEKLRLVGAAVKGSGAGMEPGPGGHFEDGWWVWSTDGPVVPELELAASGATGGGWWLCAVDCVELGVTEGEALRVAVAGC